ncbi:hypothetical protein [Moorena producens]|uniref:hypothetical protein n=1 Tax=Moorena producens TaxID=1155739 RepID=UPI000ABD6FC3|nr:hypothetical protein [Moorena producens]
MRRWGDGEMGRWGDGEMERWGDGEVFVFTSKHQVHLNFIPCSLFPVPSAKLFIWHCSILESIGVEWASCPLEKILITGKMPVPPRCPFYRCDPRAIYSPA